MKNPLRLMKSSANLLLWCLAGVLFFLILISLYPEKDKIIQSELVLILVAITFYYARQTQQQVKQAREMLEDERKKRSVMFAEAKLQEFYTPFSFNLIRLKTNIETLNWQNFRTEWQVVEDFVNKEINPLLLKYEYLRPAEAAGLITTLDLFKHETKELKEGDEEKFYSQKQEVLKTIDVVARMIARQRENCINKIDELYGLLLPLGQYTAREILTIHHKGIKK